MSDRVGKREFVSDTVSGLTGTLAAADATFTEIHSKMQRTSRLIEVVSADHERLTFGPVDLVKIDVEGHEELVLEGARSMLDKDSPALVIECFHGVEQIRRILAQWDYSLDNAESMDGDMSQVCNFVALPERLEPQREQLRARWKIEMAKLLS